MLPAGSFAILLRMPGESCNLHSQSTFDTRYLKGFDASISQLLIPLLRMIVWGPTHALLLSHLWLCSFIRICLCCIYVDPVFLPASVSASIVHHSPKKFRFVRAAAYTYIPTSISSETTHKFSVERKAATVVSQCASNT